MDILEAKITNLLVISFFIFTSNKIRKSNIRKINLNCISKKSKWEKKKDNVKANITMYFLKSLNSNESIIFLIIPNSVLQLNP